MEKFVVDTYGIDEVTNEELAQATGAGGPGWLPTLTDDCPNSIIVCC